MCGYLFGPAATAPASTARLKMFEGLVASANTPEAKRAERLQEARYRGRETGQTIGRVFLELRECVAQATEDAYRQLEGQEGLG
jgi:hypothetical protein